MEKIKVIIPIRDENGQLVDKKIECCTLQDAMSVVRSAGTRYDLVGKPVIDAGE